ncbi:MAG: DUF3305 domain-containing protein [Burkholderiales bacterium]|nr:DUF3305 domain-containing protein [Burkholderiales bacterium]
MTLLTTHEPHGPEARPRIAPLPGPAPRRPTVQAHPALRVAVQIERQRQPNPWEDWRFRIDAVMLDEGRFGEVERTLRDDGRSALFLHPGFDVMLYRDEAEGYHLNLASGAPAWFVMWRRDGGDPPRVWPERVTLSYHEAARLLDAQEQVDSLPVPPAVRDWLQAYTDVHYVPEPRRRQRPASFRPTSER